MIETLFRQENAPASYPAPPSDLSSDAANVSAAAVWSRIEGWIKHRWSERSVTWVVQGAGEWVPELKPFTLDNAEIWRDGAYESITLTQGPLGYVLDYGTYRITGTVGVNEVPPEPVMEAYRRYAEYVADTSDIGYVATSGTQNIDGAFSVSADRPASWQARAIHYSGAADLLRAWRS